MSARSSLRVATHFLVLLRRHDNSVPSRPRGRWQRASPIFAPRGGLISEAVLSMEAWPGVSSARDTCAPLNVCSRGAAHTPTHTEDGANTPSLRPEAGGTSGVHLGQDLTLKSSQAVWSS